MTVVHPNLEVTDAKIRARDVSVFYGAKKAIDAVSIDIPSKYVTAFIGPSGCGKSTFLRALNRMDEFVPEMKVDGTITFAGRDHDTIGLAVNYSRISSQLVAAQTLANATVPASVSVQSAETTIELNYRVQLTPWSTLMPNIQYVMQPNAVSTMT